MGYLQCKDTEEVGTKLILDYLSPKVDALVILEGKAPQKTFGDILLRTKNGKLVSIDAKVEQSNKYGNLFIETWSNRKRETPGWLYNLKTDFLFYLFLDSQELYIVDFPKLQALIAANPKDFREVEQKKHAQSNDTWGMLVPIERLLKQGIAVKRTLTAKGCNEETE